MRYTDFNGKKLSLLGMGAMRLPQHGEGWGMPIKHAEAEALIDYVYAQGINYFDTAYIYHGGDSEVLVGKALAKYPRESFYVADKYNLAAEADFKLQFENQLERLQMDYIDFYLLHAVADNNIDTYLTNGCIEYFLEQKKLGRIRHLGFSFHGSLSALEKMTAHRDWEFALIQLNYLDWHHNDAKALYEHLVSKCIPIQVMEPIHGGLLTKLTDEGLEMFKKAEPNKSVASWALRFVADLPGISVILSGMSNEEQATDNITTIKEAKPLTDAEQDMVLKVSTLYHQTNFATCTSCMYCVKDCPKGLDIPYLLNTYNIYKKSGEWRLFRLNALAEDKRPSACADCGICLKHCPQNLEIPKYLTDMAGMMNK